MTVNQLTTLQFANRNLAVNSAAAGKNLRKLSSGFRINTAADDAAGLAISEKMRGQIAGIGKASENTQNAVSMVQTAEGALGSTSAILTRMRELAAQASNGTYSDADRALINDEFQALKEGLDGIASSTEFNGMKLLDGSLSSEFQIGANGTADQRMALGIGDMSAAGLGLGSIDILSMGGANGALSAIDGAVDAVNSQRSGLGAAQNRLEHTYDNLQTTRMNLVQSESTIRDLDYAQEITNYTQRNIMTQASQAMMAQSMNLYRGNMLALLLR